MKIRKIATISLLVLSSFAANSVAPSKTELEAMYDKAFREFDANNYELALKDLEAIDARQPDLAESQNLRGVILMRQKDYPNAEKALQKALAADPKFWNARFNQAEIPFLEKNWAEARKRFQELLNGNASELQGEATQLIQYKILITYLMEGKENMVEALKNKFEMAPETPALQYANAAIALNKKDEEAAKTALTTAEKTFSPQLNKLFAESLYEVGWLEKPAGQTRAALELNSAAEKAAKTKAYAKAKSEEAEQALEQRDFTAARKLIDEADAADPNQAAIVNLRGEILLEQKEWDSAENEFKKAARLDPKLRDAQYNLAQVPFKKKDYTKARERFESLFSTTTGADKDRAAQLIKYKVYLTYLLEGKDSRAQKMMEQFQFTGDTPALYYAQAAWEFKHANGTKANEWVTSARKIYPPALNAVFSDAFFDLGWLQAAEPAAAVAAAETAPQPEIAPSIEPTPLPAVALAKNEPSKKNDSLGQTAQANAVVPGMEATTSTAEQSPAASSAIGATSSPSVETPVASTASPAAAKPVMAVPSQPDSSPMGDEISATKSASPATIAAAVSASPATVLAPAKVREWSEPTLSDWLSDRNTLVIAALLLASILLIAWAVIPMFRRRSANASSAGDARAAAEPDFEEGEAGGAVEQLIAPGRLAGGPPQVSLQLRASEPALRRAAMPLGKQGRGFGSGNAFAGAPVSTSVDAQVEEHVAVEALAPAMTESERIEEVASEPVAVGVLAPVLADVAAEEMAPPVSEVVEPTSSIPAETEQLSSHIDTVLAPAEAEYSAPESTFVPAAETALAVGKMASATEEQSVEEHPSESASALQDFVQTPERAEDFAAQIDEPFEEESGPVGQGQPIPYLDTAEANEASEAENTEDEEPKIAEPPATVIAVGAGAALAGIGALRHSVKSPAFAPEIVSTEPAAQQPTTPVIMPQPTPTNPSPAIRTGPTAPMTGAAPQPGVMRQPTMPQPAGGMQPAAPQGAGGMHTAVQLTFSFEIASLQLTPTFKMGALSLKPTSKIVTMRLAPSQNPQPAMNLQVTFEIATVQLAGNNIGMIRLTPSQQQRPGITSSPSFNIAGLQLVSGSDAAPVQMTPSQQGQASVHVTGSFQIATVEFSPSFEIASIVLNSTSKTVNVQLPGAGPSAVEGAPSFEVTNVQLTGNGEIGMMQLNPAGGAAKAA